MPVAKYKITFNPFTGNFDYVRRDDAGGNVVLENVPCEPDALVSHAVRMSAGIAIRAIANNSTNGNVIGIIENKVSSTLANVRILGLSSSIFTGLSENEDYYLSSTIAGELTTTPPTAPGSVVIRVGQAFSGTELIVLKGVRFRRS
jgi:hypothetical protein